MGFFDDLGKMAVDAGQKTMQKTKEISDVARINSLITQEVNKMNSMYCQIGKMYMSIHANDCEEAFSEMVNTITALEQNVREYKKQIQDIKGVRHCEQCGAEVLRGVAFCSSCGNPMPEITAPMNTDAYIKCPDCGNMVEKHVQFCTSCGRSMEQSVTVNMDFRSGVVSEVKVPPEIAEKHCPKCGVKLAEDSAFCTQCGTKL